METKTPTPCPNTMTIRRNPHRKARATPSTQIPLPVPLSSISPSSISQAIPSFPIQDILSIEIPQNPKQDLSTSESSSATEQPLSENLKVFLRIRPLAPHRQSLDKCAKNGGQTLKSRTKNAWPQNPTSKNVPRSKPKKKNESCISVSESGSVTLCPPTALQEVKRAKTEIYDGFSHVFSADSSQNEVFSKMVNPLIEDFFDGKSGLLAALGPSGSGKTYTIFGSPRDPGMVPLALRQIFSRTESCKIQFSRKFYLSMFEIYSERGKAERILDLFQDAGDLCMQQSTIRGLQEIPISDIQHAESLIARGMFKRATALTNSNSQSSRSQCIINIRSSLSKTEEEVDLQLKSVVLTIVDLAGAEREKRTGNQGARLLESNFINNTSMVFGLCLRSLLEHQKNPKKPLQKHFQNSLLTRYLRDYLEGKRRMALILTVKSGEEDYLDTTFLLRQASPFMKIKFNNVEEPSYSLCTKRHFQTFPRIERLKRSKLSNLEANVANGGNGAGNEYHLHKEDTLPQEIKEVEPQNGSVHSTTTINLEVNDGTFLEEGSTELKKERNHMIMQNFAKALWSVLKQYKKKLEVAETKIQSLSESLANEKVRSSEFEAELKDVKSLLLCGKEVSLRDESSADTSAEWEGCRPTDAHEGFQLNAGVSSKKMDESECISGEQRSDTNFTVWECGNFPGNVDCAKGRKDLKDTGIYNIQFNRDASDSGPSESVVSSPKSLILGIIDGECSTAEGYKSHNEEDEKILDQPLVRKEDELATRCDVSCAPKSESKFDSCSKALNPEKPRRRLLPASSILLKNISSLDFEDEIENEKPKGRRREKKLGPDERNRTQGSISLLRLLKSNLHL